MTGTVVITLEDGTTISGTVVLDKKSQAPTEEGVKTRILNQVNSAPDLDYSLPLRPFVNQYADGRSGSEKFTLLVSHFAKGEVDTQVDRAELVDAWNKMTGLLGGKFNSAHESRAKDKGWVYVPVAGKLALLKNWNKALL